MFEHETNVNETDAAIIIFITVLIVYPFIVNPLLEGE